MRTAKDCFELILAEIERAEKIHPDFPEDPVYMASIMAEEAGEAVKAANNIVFFHGVKEPMEEELVHTAAMAVRSLIAMDKYEINHTTLDTTLLLIRAFVEQNAKSLGEGLLASDGSCKLGVSMRLLEKQGTFTVTRDDNHNQVEGRFA
jgi:hypothetical protein